jgi:hypothetical protein
MAAKAATKKVIGLTDGKDADLLANLEQMHQEAAESEERCSAVAGGFEGKKTAILEEAQSTKGKGAEMMKTYLDDDSEALDGFEFLTTGNRARCRPVRPAAPLQAESSRSKAATAHGRAFRLRGRSLRRQISSTSAR